RHRDTRAGMDRAPGEIQPFEARTAPAAAKRTGPAVGRPAIDRPVAARKTLVEVVGSRRNDGFDERFPGSDGAIYGWPTHGWSGSFRRGGSRSGLEGLYLAGGTVHPGPGVPMTAISGRLAAASVLSDLGLGR
ncbi:MAG: hypothetical protein AAFX10_14800, partial [Pseudomonadota bacterium]